MKTVGVLALQGNVSEHVDALERAAGGIDFKCSIKKVKYPEELKTIDALALPGGESTTIGKLLQKHKLFDLIKTRILKGMPVLATCAGMVLMAKQGNRHVEKTGQPLFGLMNYSVNRNAFGRQKESFEADLSIPALGLEKFPAVFIRAPAVLEMWGDAKPLAVYDGKTVLVQQDRMLAAAFHPELSKDTRLHEFFLEMI